MAPEMATGPAVDGRADLYSVGCVAYYLLTGRQVFEGGTAMQVFAQHLQAAPVPPSQRGAGVPPDLERVVLACLAKNPDDRPPSAAALDALLGEAGVEPWTDADARQWWTAPHGAPDAPRGSPDATVTGSAPGQSETRLVDPRDPLRQGDGR
jgi:serine/threonine-protein kinase